MADDGSLHTSEEKNEASVADTGRAAQLGALILRRSKLTEREAALLREEFGRIMALHHAQVWEQFRRRGLMPQEVDDLVQESFVALYESILAQGFPGNVAGLLYTLAQGKLLNHLRSQKRMPISLGLPSSRSQMPESTPELERALDLRELHLQLLVRLSPEHQDVVEKVILNGLTHEEAAEALGLAEGTVKSRLLAAKRALLVEAKKFLPPSQRGLDGRAHAEFLRKRSLSPPRPGRGTAMGPLWYKSALSRAHGSPAAAPPHLA